MKKRIFLKFQRLFYSAVYSESLPERYSEGYAAMERVGDIIYRCENNDINTGHSISASCLIHSGPENLKKFRPNKKKTR